MNVLRRLLSILLCVAVITGGEAFAHVSDVPKSIGVEQSLLADLSDDRLDDHSLLAAALIAGGIDDAAQIDRFESNFQTLVAKLKVSIKQRRSIRDRAAAVHAFLHNRVLHGSYQSTATDVSAALTGGEYNCVTATVIYMALARACGLKTQAIQLPEHVRCEVIADGVAFGIEPTSLTTWQATATTLKGSPRTLTDVELIATVYYNRGVAAFDSGDFAESIDLNAIALDLDPACAPARENLLAAINNRVVELVTASDLSGAAEVLSRGEAVDAEYGPFRTNRGYLERVMGPRSE